MALTLALAGCGSSAEEEAARVARMTLDDGATPLGAGASSLTGGFDRSTSELTDALPLTLLDTEYTEVQTMEAENLRPSEATGCKPDAVTTPSLPATEALATRAPGTGEHQPETADVVAARGRTEPEAQQLLDAVRKAAGDCAGFTTELRDLGEGSFAPAERGATTVDDAREGEWSGLRTTTSLALTGKGWAQDVTRQSLVLRRGQVVLHVRVEGADASEVAATTDVLMERTIANVEGDTSGPSAAG